MLGFRCDQSHDDDIRLWHRQLGHLNENDLLMMVNLRSSRPLELIHSDVCGPIRPVAWNGNRYFVSFIDDYTHFEAIYVVKQKSDVLDKFKEYEAMATVHFNAGGEYMSSVKRFVVNGAYNNGLRAHTHQSKIQWRNV